MAWEKRANHTEGRIARGGKLAHDDTRLTFVPHAIDRATGGGSLDVALTDVVEVGEQARTMNPFDGGMRKRLRVVPADGQSHLFVVGGLAGVVSELQGAVAAAKG